MLLATISFCCTLLSLLPEKTNIAYVSDSIEAVFVCDSIICDSIISDSIDDESIEPDSVGNLFVFDDAFYYKNPLYAQQHPKRWWVAGAEVMAIDVGNMLMNRYIFNFDYSHISWNTIKRNFSNGFVWDNDDLIINQIGHPYQGSYYYNVSRANGLNYWQSLPFTAFGSVLWELFCESDPPSINDLITTPVGGAAIGEITWRLSDLVLDDSKRGFQRFWREAVAFVLNPMRGINRVFYGDAWRYRSNYYKYHDQEAFPINFRLGAGFRHLNNRFDIKNGTNNLELHLGLEYGDVFSKENVHPYDYFQLETKLGFFGNQPIIEQFNALGYIYGKTHTTHRGNNLQLGIYQHFNYYDSNDIEDEDNDTRSPYLVSETASFGPGAIVNIPMSRHSSFTQFLHFTGVLLGAVKSDHYSVLDRRYNFGSGYSVKGGGEFQWRHGSALGLSLNHYHIFTWKDYDESYIDAGEDPHYLNSQGNQSHTAMNIARLTFSQNLAKNISWHIDGAYYYRHSNYKKYNKVKSHSFELCTLLMFRFP